VNEYKKRLAQQGSQKLNSETAAPQSINGIPNSVLNDVFAGKRRATNEMMGHRVDPAPSVMARMSQAFGMDFSGVQVYRSDAMVGTGMGGMAQGNKVVIGSDVDLNTQKGQALLGHEFSHIRAQSMGIGGGNGLLQDAALEHQADNEGLLAARGMSISGESMGMTTGLGMAGMEGLTPLGGGMSATASAPMQAGLWEKWFGTPQQKQEYYQNKNDNKTYHPHGQKRYTAEDYQKNKDEDFDYFLPLMGSAPKAPDWGKGIEPLSRENDSGDTDDLEDIQGLGWENSPEQIKFENELAQDVKLHFYEDEDAAKVDLLKKLGRTPFNLDDYDEMELQNELDLRRERREKMIELKEKKRLLQQIGKDPNMADCFSLEDLRQMVKDIEEANRIQNEEQ